MKKGSTLFLKTVLVILALAAIGVCVIGIIPTLRNPDAGMFHPMLWILLGSVIPFLFALYQAWKLLKYIDSNTAFSELSIKALHNIKYSGAVISVLYTIGLPFFVRLAEEDDAPGVVLLALIFIAAPVVVSVFAAVLQKLVQSAIDIKKENELTV